MAPVDNEDGIFFDFIAFANFGKNKLRNNWREDLEEDW